MRKISYVIYVIKRQKENKENEKSMGVKFACNLEWIAKWISIKNKNCKRNTKLYSNVIEIDRKKRKRSFFEISLNEKFKELLRDRSDTRVFSWENILIYKSFFFFFIPLILETISVAEIWATDELFKD